MTLIKLHVLSDRLMSKATVDIGILNKEVIDLMNFAVKNYYMLYSDGTSLT